MLQGSIRLLFSMQKSFYDSELHNVREDGDAVTRNMIAELTDRIYLCRTRTPNVSWEIALYGS